MITILAETLSPNTIDLVQLIAALGVGGIGVAIINSVSNRRGRRVEAKKTQAETESISVGTQAMLSELIETSTAALRESLEDQRVIIERQRAKIELLETMIQQLRKELDESVLIQRLRDAEQDNIYLRGRVKTLIGRVESLRRENEQLVAQLSED